MGLPLVAYLFGRSGLFARIFWLGCVGLLAYALFLTNSRGGLIAAGVEFLAYTWMRRGLILAAVLSAGGVVVLALLPSRLDNLDASEESAAGRIEAWYSGLEMFKAHPLFGVGAGNFTEYHELTAHNSFVLAFAELGAFGYFFWLSFVLLSVSMAWRVARLGPSLLVGEAAEDDSLVRMRYRKIGAAYLLSLLGFLAGAFFLSRTYNVLLTIGCASCVALYQDARRRWPVLPTYRLRQWLGCMVVIEAASLAAMFVLVRFLLLKAGV
jgi:putative inorganic carbon (HCO3(-)) transporter